MRFKDICYLVTEVRTRDSRGVSHLVTDPPEDDELVWGDLLTGTWRDPNIPTRTESRSGRRKVFCNVRTLTDSAFYEAASAGIHPAASLEIRKCDYNNEVKVEFRGVDYNVERVAEYSEFVVLTLTEQTGDRR